MNYSNKKFVKHLLILMLCLVFSSSFSQTVNQLGVYQIGTDADKLSENAIFVQKVSPYRILTAHNSNKTDITVMAYLSTNDGASWSFDAESGWCDPTVIITNNSCFYLSMIESGYYTQINVKCDVDWNGIPPSGPGDDKPFFWYDNVNDIIYYSVRNGNTFKIYKLTSNGFIEIYQTTQNSNSKVPVPGDPSIRIKTDNNGCIYAVINNGSRVYFTRTLSNDCIPSDNVFNFIDPIEISTSTNLNWPHESATIAVNGNGSEILIAYTTEVGSDLNTVIRRSSDYGESFQDVSSGLPTTGKQFHPWLSYCTNGSIDLYSFVYYNRDGTNRVSVSYTTNYGSSWSTQNVATTASTFGEGGSSPDYIGLDMVYKNNLFYVYPVFSDYPNSQWKSYIAPFTLNYNNNEDDNAIVNKGLKLFQNNPNPFNPVTKIKFSLDKPGNASLKVYNLLGELVNTVTDTYMNSGEHSFTFDGSNLASGIYYYILESNNTKVVKKMLLIK